MNNSTNKKIITQAVNVVLALFFSIIFLSIFCYLYSYSGVHITNKTGATDYKWESNQYKSTMTEGHSWLFLDQNGFNNISTYEYIDILLMGSSHMEAINIKQKNNVSELLNSQLDYNTYNIGMSGHQIYNIINNYKSAIEYYNPNKYVIIETDRINLDINQMNLVINNEYNKITSYDSGIMYYTQKIPSIKAIYKKLQDWINLDNNSNIKNNQKEQLITNEQYEESLYNFLNIINSNSKDKNIKTIIFYHPSEKLNKTGEIIYDTNVEKLQIFEKICNELDIIFIDMTPHFNKEYKNNYKLAHGFNNTHVGSGHLNETGHRIIAKTIKEHIKEMESVANDIH